MSERAAAGRSARIGRAVLRRLPLAGTLVGVALGVWLVARYDLGAIAAAFGRVGWLGLIAVVLVRAGIVVLCGLAWASPVAGLAGAGTGAFVALRFVREGINVLLPVASVGGDVVGGRLLTFWRVGGALAAASILVDMLIQVGTQLLFTLAGVALLMRLEGEAAAALALWTLEAIAAGAALLTAFFVFQRAGGARRVEQYVAGLGRRFVREAAPEDRVGGPDGVQGALDAIWAKGRWTQLLTALALHLAAWALGAAEVWIALACIGADVTMTEAVVMEALAQALKSAAFVVPSGLGIQEGGFVLAGALFGVDAQTAIALSLVKRVPDVALGLPALVLWQMLEARRAPLLASRR